MRVVSLLPAATEIVAALGATTELVGRSHECDWPPDATCLPCVSRPAFDLATDAAEVDRLVQAAASEGAPLVILDAERIADLDPDVLLTQAICDVCAVREGDVRDLARRLPRHPRVVTLGATSFDGVFDDIHSVAEALDAADRGLALTTTLRERVRRVHEILAAARAPRPRVAVLEWTDPPYTAGHWVPDMIRRAGGTDVLAKAGERSHAISSADVEASNPEVIVVAPCGYDVARAADAARTLQSRAEWAWMRDRPTWAIDANGLLSRPGPRLTTGVETLAALLHSELFGLPSEDHATRIDKTRDR